MHTNLFFLSYDISACYSDGMSEVPHCSSAFVALHEENKQGAAACGYAKLTHTVRLQLRET